LDSPFWLFSVSVYGSRGVQDECIELQDSFGIDVNVLLFCAFVGAVHGALLSEKEISDAMAVAAQWQDSVVRPLRATRRALNQSTPPQAVIGPLVKDFRTNLKSVELEAERIEQIALESWFLSRLESWARAEPDTAIAANIRGLFAISGSPAQHIALPKNLIAAASGAR
jgi:uncharacterized protein (TIGR02444 family)